MYKCKNSACGKMVGGAHTVSQIMAMGKLCPECKTKDNQESLKRKPLVKTKGRKVVLSRKQKISALGG